MLHGPCKSCLKDGKCLKRFPKPFIEDTQTSKDGYPLYRRRRDNKIQVIKNHFYFDNSWVVPYNP